MKPSIFFLLFLLSSCSTDPDYEWWKHTIIYQILPYSFKDSNCDGIGDLKGITSKMDYFEDLKIETLHLTPIYESTFRDMGYDITNYYKIYPAFGTMDDFDELIREMNNRGMKLIMDLVFNHSGHEHEWFKKSIDRIAPYTDFYVWKDAKGFDDNTQAPIPPNEWTSVFGGSAWEWNEKRRQFYLHQFMVEQADFDLNNSDLKEELKKIMKFWLEKGVAGFRMDAAIFFFEDKYFRDDDNEVRQHNQDESYEFVHELRLFLDEYTAMKKDFERIFIAEAHTDDRYVLRYYDQKDFVITHFPYAFQMEAIYSEINAQQFQQLIGPWLQAIPENAVSAWMTQDHDGTRVGSRIMPEYSDLLTMISMMLPGTVGIYYGQEIAMNNGFIQDYQKKDISGNGSRDPTRLIMQWDDSLNAGFTNHSEPYLPPAPDFVTRNVKYQSIQDISPYNMFKDLSTLRETEVFKYGDFEEHILSEFVYVFTRSHENQKLVVIVNFGGSPSVVNLNKIVPEFPQYAIVAAASINADFQKGFELDENVWNGFIMNPRSSIVFQMLFWKTGPNAGQPAQITPKSITYTSVDENGKTIDVAMKNGVVKVNKKIIYITSDPKTKFTFNDDKIYADGKPIYHLTTQDNNPFADSKRTKSTAPLRPGNLLDTTNNNVVKGKDGTISINGVDLYDDEYFRIGIVRVKNNADGDLTINGKIIISKPPKESTIQIPTIKINATAVKQFKLTLEKDQYQYKDNNFSYLIDADQKIYVKGKHVYTLPPKTPYSVSNGKIYLKDRLAYNMINAFEYIPSYVKHIVDDRILYIDNGKVLYGRYDKISTNYEVLYDDPELKKGIVRIESVDGDLYINGNVVLKYNPNKPNIRIGNINIEHTNVYDFILSVFDDGALLYRDQQNEGEIYF